MRTKHILAASLRDSDVPLGGVFSDTNVARLFEASLKEHVQPKFALLLIAGTGMWYGRGLKRDKGFAAAFYDGFQSALLGTALMGPTAQRAKRHD